MFKALTSLLARPLGLHAELELDHIELTGERLILGVQVKWTNSTGEPLEIGSVVIHLFHRGKKETPVNLHYYERFARIPYQKAVAKMPGATSFRVAAGATQTQSLRFMTHEITDLNAGTYAAELLSVVPEGTYVHDFDLKVVPQVKHHTSGQEGEKGKTSSLSSAFTRALRIASN